MAEPEYPVLRELETKLKLQWIDTDDYLATQRAIIQVEPDHAYLELPRGRKGDKGDPGPAISIQGIVAADSQLPANAEIGHAYVNTSTKGLAVWNGAQWFKVDNFAGVDADVQQFSRWFAQIESDARRAVDAAERAEFAAEEIIQQVEGDFATKNYADSKDWVKRTILDGEDLNSFTENGLYLIPLSNTMTSLLNRPFGSTGPGFLSVTNSDGTVIQELTTYSADGPITMSRTTLRGVFQEWVNPSAVTKPFLWTDLNEAVIEGDYDIARHADVRDLTNRPPASPIPASARISVRRAGGTRLIQDWVGIITGGIGERWQRNRNSLGEWESWTLVHTDISRAGVLDILGAIQTDHVLTVGDSQVGATYGWANLLADVSGQTVVNRGESGNTPDEALIETGGWRLPIEPVSLVPGERVSVSFAGDYPVLWRDFSHNGYVLGKRVSLWYTHSTGGWEALLNADEEPLTLSEPTLWASIYADFAPEKLSRRIVWFGGNTIRAGRRRPDESVVEHVQKAYSRAIDAWGDTTIVCGYVPAYGDTVGRDAANELNTWLSHTVPTQFLDMRHRIQLAAADILGRALSSSELQDIDNGYLPRPLYRSDLVHLTDEAHVKIADIVAEFPHGATPQLSIRSNPAPVVSLTGTGSPEGSVTAPVGSVYTDTAATNGAIRWVKASGTGNTGWRDDYGDTTAALEAKADQSYVDDAKWSRPTFTGDLNDLTTPGTYPVASSATNRPSGAAGSIEVVPTGAGSGVYQQFKTVDSQGLVYGRIISDPGATPTEWQVLADQAYRLRQLGTIDLNEAITPGHFAQHLTGSATTARNYPINKRGLLLVYVMGSGLISQSYFTPRGAFCRERNADGSWLEWGSLSGELDSDLIQQIVDQSVQDSIQEAVDHPIKKSSPETSLVTYGRTQPDPWVHPDTDLYWNGPNGTQFYPAGYKGGGYVGTIGDTAGYSSLMVEKADSDNLYISAVNPATNRHVTYRAEGKGGDDMPILSGVWVGEVGSNGRASRDVQITGRSNLEWAFRIDIDGVEEYVPWHGTNTAVAAGGAYYTDSSGNPVDVDGQAHLDPITGLNGFKIHQPLWGRHPSTGDKNLMRIDQVTTFSPDGLVRSETFVEFLESVKLVSQSVGNLTVNAGVATRFHSWGGESIDVPAESGEYQSIELDPTMTSGLFTGDTNHFAAVSLIEPEYTQAKIVPGLESGGPTFIQVRPDGFTKLYQRPLAVDQIVPRGVRWRLGAEWRHGEVGDPDLLVV